MCFSEAMLNVVLVNPARGDTYAQPPMGLALLAAVLEAAGYPVTIVDANALNLSPAQIATQAAGADVIGLTAMTPSIGFALTTAAHLKEALPNARIVLGGAHATLLPEETLSSAPALDVIVRGEGEISTPALLRALEQGTALDDVPGISFRKDDRIVHTPSPAAVIDVETLPYLAYHLLPRGVYRPHPPHGREMPFAAVIASRGCPYHCSYCSKPVFGNQFRGQSPKRVADELEKLVRDFGVREVAFYDDVFTLNRKRVMGICAEILNRGLKLHWSCESRVNLVDAEMLQQMRRAGCYTIAYGIESAAPEVLAGLDKDATPEQAAAAVLITRRAGIQVIGYFMIGSPGETSATIHTTLDFAKSLKLDYAQFSVTTPFPGTRLYERYLAEGYGGEIPWENFVYASTDGAATPVFASAELSREDLANWSARAYREFYLRPGYVWQRLSGIRGWEDLRLNLQGLALLWSSIRTRRQK